MINSSENQIIVWAKNFSTYAIAYSQTSGTFDVSYSGNGSTGGSVPATSAVAAGTTWSSPANSGNLTKNNYKFIGWALTSDAKTAMSTYTINANTVFYAVWEYINSSSSTESSIKTITATSGDGGSISPSGSVVCTRSNTFTITADEGYYISDVLVDGVSVGAVSSYTFYGITKSHTIVAKFAVAGGLPYYIGDNDNEVFIGFAAQINGEMKYIAPEGVTVLFKLNPKSFTDIAGHWAQSYIDFVTEREIFVGTGDNTFSPDTGMTRAMFATVIGRLYKRSYGDLVVAGEHAFTDCDYDDWYGAYVDWCAENGIIIGVGGGLFEPDREVTREEMAAMLYRFVKFLDISSTDLEKTQLSFPDAAGIASWATEAATYCQLTEIITGRDGGNFVPQGTATRAEVATILERFIGNTLD